MAEGSDYRIEKMEKGALQRFKNQNLLLKKFGEVGLQVYKVITGRRTSEELRKDLDMDSAQFAQILKYMEEAGMVKLTPLGKGAASEEEAVPEEEEAPKRKKKAAPPAEEIAPEEEAPEEELAPELEIEEEAPKKKKKAPEPEEAAPEEEAPEEEAEEPAPKKRKGAEEEIVPEEIVPELGEEEAPKKKKKAPEPEEEEAAPEGPAPEEEAGEEAAPKRKKTAEEEFAPEELQFGGEPEPVPEKGGEDVEKIIRDRYGDIGIRVYNLIDGQKTAEEIMEETGLSEAKLVEILDFLDEQGIIKLEYPKGKPEAAPSEEAPKEMATEEFAPMIEGEEDTDKAPIKEVSPDIAPAKTPVPIVKSVQVRAKTMLRYGDAGDKVLSAIDGKADVIDLALKLNVPLYKIVEMVTFVRDEGGVLLNTVPRTEVRRKYGDDGFTVYKKYGKEGLMLYELIGKEFTVKEMADKVMTDKAKVVDMFLFIYEVLGIELPINKEALMKQLGL